MLDCKLLKLFFSTVTFPLEVLPLHFYGHLHILYVSVVVITLSDECNSVTHYLSAEIYENSLA